MRTSLMARVLAVVFLVCGLLAKASYGQSTDAAVGGQITDEQGRVVPGVTVLLTNLNTGLTYQAKTNGDGFYSAPNLPPGIYRANVTKDGFKSIVKGDIELHVQDVASINFQVQVGSVTETVTVEGGAPLVNTQSAVVSTIIDREFLGQLPLNGRSFNTLLQLTPGVVIAPTSTTSPGQFSINGQRTNANYFQIDGVSVNFGIGTVSPAGLTYQGGGGGTQAFNAFGGTSSLVSVDAMQEFRVETSSFAPEYGHTPGGQVIIETRSGTRDFHGDVFDYFRNTVLDANNWFNALTTPPTPRTPEHQNDFGAVFGGPIVKNKTFFFLSYEGLRLLQPQTTLTSVPSAPARSSAVPAAAPYIDAFPQPNGPVNSSNPNVAQFTGAFDNRIDSDATSIRIDHNLSSHWSLFGRFNYAPSKLEARALSVLSELDSTRLNTTTTSIGLTGVFTPRVTNSFRFNYSRQNGFQTATLDSFGGATPLGPSLLLPTPLSSSSGVGLFFIRAVRQREHLPLVGSHTKG